MKKIRPYSSKVVKVVVNDITKRIEHHFPLEKQGILFLFHFFGDLPIDWSKNEIWIDEPYPESHHI